MIRSLQTCSRWRWLKTMWLPKSSLRVCTFDRLPCSRVQRKMEWVVCICGSICARFVCFDTYATYEQLSCSIYNFQMSRNTSRLFTKHTAATILEVSLSFATNLSEQPEQHVCGSFPGIILSEVSLTQLSLFVCIPPTKTGRRYKNVKIVYFTPVSQHYFHGLPPHIC